MIFQGYTSFYIVAQVLNQVVRGLHSFHFYCQLVTCKFMVYFLLSNYLNAILEDFGHRVGEHVHKVGIRAYDNNITILFESPQGLD